MFVYFLIGWCCYYVTTIKQDFFFLFLGGGGGGGGSTSQIALITIERVAGSEWLANHRGSWRLQGGTTAAAGRGGALTQ